MSLRFYKIALAASALLNVVLVVGMYYLSGLSDTLSLLQAVMGALD